VGRVWRRSLSEIVAGDEIKEVVRSGDVGFGVSRVVFEGYLSELEAEGWDAMGVMSKGVLDDRSKDGGIEGWEAWRCVVRFERIDTELELELARTDEMIRMDVMSKRGGCCWRA
jgi:hypothetical protein